MNIVIDKDALGANLEALAGISAAPPPVVTRVVFSAADLRARAHVKRLCAEAGLQVREDAVGNTFARWEGSDPNLAPVATGSHIDAIPNAGRYDGTVGVLGGLEAIRALSRAGFKPRRSVELIIFTAEEPTRFGIGCLGSRALVGSLAPDAGATLKDPEGKSLDDLRLAAGFEGSLESARMSPGAYSAFVELHIEQGPILEQKQIRIGIVTAIAAPAGLRIWLEGEGGHAGAVLMPERRDAFLAAAEIALAVEAAATSTGSRDTVGTCGVCEVFPGAINSIPSRVKIELDIRDSDEARRDGVLEKVRDAIATISTRRSVAARTELLNADPPAICDGKIVTALARAAETHQMKFERLVSRAYHDALFMARIAPSAMLFIPCRGGVSHRPDEYSSPEAIADGVLVLAETLADLAR